MTVNDPDKATVLVVDDTPDNLSLMSGLLKGDYKVRVANNGEKALRMAIEHPPDLILLDVMMPGMDGMEVCKRLKTDPRTERIPVIFLTSQDEEYGEEQGLTLGAADYITKPFSIPITMARIRNHVRLKQQADLLAELAVESARLNDEAQRATRAREDVLAVVAHDLRNPLSTILMSSVFLQEPPGDDPFLAPRKLGERIHRSAARMETLIKDLLDLAAIEAGQLAVERQPHAALSLVNDAIEMMQPLAKAKGLVLSGRIEDGQDSLVSCDRGRVLQVFSNLIGNAVKFTPAGESITVLGATEVNGFRLTVEDSGPGIPADQLPHIFDRYWQGRATDRRGVGLGLSITAGIVAAHGGRVWVDSQLGKGSAFHFTLPRAV
jgi:two-component system sensor histidine kinase/response regulator